MEYTIDNFFSINFELELFVVYGCFHCNLVFRRDQTIYSICEYFVVNDVSINFKPNQKKFSILEFLV